MAVWPFRRRQPAGEEQRTFTGWPWDTGGPPPYIAVGVERALSLVPVFGAARVLADNVASLTPALYTVDQDGVWNKQPTPSLFTQPSVNGTLYDWLNRGVHSMALWGDAVGYVTQRNYYGIPTMAEWLNPENVTVQDGSQGNASYNSASATDYNTSDFSGPGSYMDPRWYWRGRNIPREDIIHIPWMTMPYKVRGLSPIGAYQTVANVGLGAQDYQSAWFLNGGVPPATVRNTQQKVSKEEADIITSRIVTKLQQRKPLVIGNDWEFTPVAIKPNEAQFIETAKLTANHIATIYGIPPEMIGGETGGSLTYTTVSMNALNFLTFSLRPWLVRIETALSALFPRGTFVKFDTSDLLRMDPMQKAQVDAITLGYYPPASRTVNEVRVSNDQPPLPGGDELVPPYRPGMGSTDGTEPEPEPEQPAEPDAVHVPAGETPPPGADADSARNLSGRSALIEILGKTPEYSTNGHTFAVPN